MHTVSLLLFELKLIYYLVDFIWDVIKIKLGKQRLLLGTILVVVGFGILFSLISVPKEIQPKTTQVFSITPTQPDLFVEKHLTPEEMQHELAYWQELLKTQPSHRDILINISQLYRALGDEQQATYYWEQARKTDPNNPVFD